LCSFLHSLVTSTLLGPNIFLSTLFSNILSLRPPPPRYERYLCLSTGIKWQEYEAHCLPLHTIVPVLRTHKFLSAVCTWCIRGVHRCRLCS
jgi:hypothetical protein